jgi:hypothetical protein
MPYVGDNLQFIPAPPRCVQLERVLFLKDFLGSLFKVIMVILVWEWLVRRWWLRHAIWPAGLLEQALSTVGFLAVSLVVWLILHVNETRWREELDKLNAEWREEARRGARRGDV